MNNYKYLLEAGAIFFVLISACTSPADSGEELTNTELLQGSWVIQKAVIDGDEQPITEPGLGQIEATFDGNEFKYIFPEIDNTGFPTGDTDSIEGTWSLNETEDALIINHSSIEQDVLKWKIVNLSKGNLETEYIEYFPGSEEPSVFLFSYRLK